MSTLVQLQKTATPWEPPPTKPLDEAIWRAWEAKGREEDVRSSAARWKALRWLLGVALIAAAAWLYFAPSPPRSGQEARAQVTAASLPFFAAIPWSRRKRVQNE